MRNPAIAGTATAPDDAIHHLLSVSSSVSTTVAARRPSATAASVHAAAVRAMPARLSAAGKGEVMADTALMGLIVRCRTCEVTDLGQISRVSGTCASGARERRPTRLQACHPTTGRNTCLPPTVSGAYS